MPYSQGDDENEGCGPISDPSAQGFGLPAFGKVDSDSTPNQLAMDKAIEARYGKPGDTMENMKITGKQTPRFGGPGQE